MLTFSKCLIIEVTSWNHIMSNYPFILYHTIVFHTDYNEKNWLVADPKVGSFHLFTFPGPPYSWMCGHTPTSLCVRKHMGCLIRCIMQWDSSENTKAIGLGLSTRTTQLSSISPSSWACYGTQRPSALPQGSSDGKTNLSLQTELGHVGRWKHKANTRHPRSHLERPPRQTKESKLYEPWSNSPIRKVTSKCIFEMKSTWLLHASGIP